jgi:parvulin-like peptidyl-prolyl isomerase
MLDATRTKLARSLVAVACTALLLVVAGCGRAASGSPSPVAPASSASSAQPGSPAEQCLAIAGAKHERKPSEPEKITAAHVLIKYAGAKKAPETVTRTREEACLRAQEAHASLEHGAPFSDVVKKYSEEPGAASREGSLGQIERSNVVPPFADAAFELAPGEVSQVVETPFGFHVILRTE